MKHYIIVKWNELVIDKNEMLKNVHKAFNDVVKIEGIYNFEVYQNVTNKDNRYDVMIKIECSNDGLSNYDKSKLHQNWKDNYSKYILKKAIFDSE